jgi:acyl dehydratase
MQYNRETIHQFIGQELGVSGWVLVDQDRINRFAECTGDFQWIHVDEHRARHETPFGSTIAHGYLTLSLLPLMMKEISLAPEGAKALLNYGSDKIRFIAPVRSGTRIRNHAVLLEVHEKSRGRLLLKVRHTIEVENQPGPAMVADTLTMVLFE